MKKFFLLYSPLFLLFSLQVSAQGTVYFQPVAHTSINLRGAPVELARIDATLPSPGWVVVHFNGECYPDPGDRIVLAASQSVNWQSNDGNVGTETTDESYGRVFSHTRAYHVSAGAHSFYAVGQNFVEMDGSGFASVYGSLTAEFFPDSGPVTIASTGIVMTADATSVVTLAQQTIHASSAGKILVRLDGWCTNSPGDRLVLAASNTQAWSANDGHVSVEAINTNVDQNSFSHTRLFDIATAGDYTYYALMQVDGETDGDGNAYVGGNLLVEFFPASGGVVPTFQAFSKPGLDLNGPTQAITSITINAPTAGKVLVDFDGTVTSDVGDYIVMAAGRDIFWFVDDGNITVHALDADLNRNSIAHSRMYDVTAGSHTFYAVGQDFVPGGSGIVDMFGQLTVKYFPDINTAIKEVTDAQFDFDVFPDPTYGEINIILNEPVPADQQVSLLDINGEKLFGEKSNGTDDIMMDLSSLPEGVYFVKVGEQLKKVIKL